MIKQIMIFFMLFVGFVGLAKSGYMDEQLEGTEDFFSMDSNRGEFIDLPIEPTSETVKINPGTYRITKSSPGSWTASYDILVDDDRQITAVTNKRFKALRGSIISNSLTYTSNQAVYHFRYRSGVVVSNKRVTATISNGRLVVI